MGIRFFYVEIFQIENVRRVVGERVITKLSEVERRTATNVELRMA